MSRKMQGLGWTKSLPFYEWWKDWPWSIWYIKLKCQRKARKCTVGEIYDSLYNIIMSEGMIKHGNAVLVLNPVKSLLDNDSLLKLQKNNNPQEFWNNTEKLGPRNDNKISMEVVDVTKGNVIHWSRSFRKVALWF